MRIGEKVVQRRVALALAHLCLPGDQRTIFVDNNGNCYMSSYPYRPFTTDILFISLLYFKKISLFVN